MDFEQIKKNYADEVERARGRTLTSRDEFPLSYEEITPAWLTAVLGRDGTERSASGTSIGTERSASGTSIGTESSASGTSIGTESSASGTSIRTQVTACRLGDEDEGTSSRRHIHLEWNRAGLPASVFSKSTMTLESRYLLGMNGGIAAEATFYNTVLPTLDVRAPHALFAAYDPDTLNSIIIMRDLAGQVTFGSHELDLTLEQARSQLRLLATLHARYYDSPELDTTLAAFNSWEDYFAITVDAAGFGPACARGFAAAEDVIPPALFARADEIWPATLRSVAEHARLPRTLIHSDVHLKNWYVDADGEMGLNDWQCACKGNWGRDLAYAISTALSVENRRAWDRDLVAYYVEQLHAAGAPEVDFDTAWRLYRQNLFSALAWWTGTLGQPPEAPKMQPPATSREFIRRMTHAIHDVDALAAFRP